MMQSFALVGKSGTGKSFHSLELARDYNIEAVIDDGLLISHSRVLAGHSAKHEKTRMGSVKCAIFEDKAHAEEIIRAFDQNEIQSVLVIGTSEKMVRQIAARLSLPEFERIFNIQDVATPEEIEIATKMRNTQGKHIIPVPVFELKKQFSGYFIRSLFSSGKRDRETEKTVMRPSYSYLGEFKISPKVISDICTFEAMRTHGISKVLKVKSVPDTDYCIDINIDIEVLFQASIPEICSKLQKKLEAAVENTTSINVNNVNVYVKAIKIQNNEENIND